MAQRARIKLLSTNPVALTEISEELRKIITQAGVRMRGPIPLPTKKVILPVRKSPCGNGTQTWEHYEMKIHKRLIDIDADEKIMMMLMRVKVPKDVDIQVKL